MLAACPFPANHGTPGSIREMAEALAGLGHEIHVVTYHFGDETPIEGVHLHRIPRLTKDDKVVVGPTVKRPLYDLQMVFEARRVVRKYDIDLMHAHAYEGALVAKLVRMATGCRFIYSAHNRMSDELSSYKFFRFHWLANSIAWVLDATVPNMGDRCLPHSKNLETFLHEKGLADRCEPVLNFGIDLSELPIAPDAAQIETYDLHEGPIITYAGVMNRFQRLDLLIDAMASVLKIHPHAKLLLVVNVHHEIAEQNVRDQAEKLGIADSVTITEPMELDGVRTLLLASDIGVVPRPAAPGFPIKLLNYMAAKLPCVMFESSASRLQHGENIYLAHEDTADSLAKALLELLGDKSLREHLGESAYHFVHANHDRRRTAEKIVDAYHKLLGPPNHEPEPEPETAEADTSPKRSTCQTPSVVNDRGVAANV